MKFSEAFDAFVQARAAEGIRPNTLAAYRHDARKFLQFAGDVDPIKATWKQGYSEGGLTAAHFDTAFAGLHEQGYSAGTINIFQSSMRAFCKWLRDRGMLLPDQNPLAGRKWLRDPPKPRKRLSVAQVKDLLRADLHPRDRVLVAMGIFLFLRQSEAASLRISDVDLETNRIRVTVHKTKDVDLMVIPVELRPILRDWLTYYASNAGPLQPDWFLIPAKEGANLGREPRLRPTKKMDKIAGIVNRALDGIGFPTKDERGHSTREGMHTLRRSSALNLYYELSNRGVDQALMTCKSFLHHASVTTTERYLGLESGREARNKDFEDQPLFPSLSEDKVVHLGERRAMQSM
jgi:integrase